MKKHLKLKVPGSGEQTVMGRAHTENEYCLLTKLKLGTGGGGLMVRT